ncbi:MAG: ABC transporter substrate-binding protein [Calditrichaeota bacterium]|nr:ABC transporter substrate-binding protein [Calditrichota bacterium]
MKQCILTISLALALTAQQRIIVIGHAYTDIVDRLGMMPNVVAISNGAKSIKSATGKYSLGSFRNLSLESILALNPDLLILPEGSGPQHVIDQLKKVTDLTVKLMPTITTLDQLHGQIGELAAILQKSNEANRLITILKQQESELKAAVAKISSRQKSMFIYARGTAMIFVAGYDTQADLTMRLAGLDNVVTEFDGFKPLTAESILQSDPEYVLMLKSGAQSLGDTNSIFDQPGLKLSKAAKNKRLLLVDDDCFLSIGPQTLSEAGRIMRQVYAEIQ